MKIAICIAVTACALLSGCATSMTTHSTRSAHDIPVIRISGAIDGKGASDIALEIRKASRQSPKAIIVEIDSPGGMLSACESLAQSMSKADTTVYALVGEAIGGGAMLALAADRIYLRPHGCVGGCTPLLLTPGGDLDKDVVAKVIAVVEARIASIASENGHNPDIARCMVNKDREYKEDGVTISKKGALLHLTAQEAKTAGLSEGTFGTAEALAAYIRRQAGRCAAAKYGDPR